MANVQFFPAILMQFPALNHTWHVLIPILLLFIFTSFLITLIIVVWALNDAIITSFIHNHINKNSVSRPVRTTILKPVSNGSCFLSFFFLFLVSANFRNFPHSGECGACKSSNFECNVMKSNQLLLADKNIASYEEIQE